LGAEPLNTHIEKPTLQVAVDVPSLETAVKIARVVSEAGARFIEAGTPLIKNEGAARVLRKFREQLPRARIVADFKTMDAGALEAEIAFKNGGDVLCVLGVADNATIRSAVEVADAYGKAVLVDLMKVPNPVKRAVEVEKLGASIVCLHVGLDVQKTGETVASKLELVRKVSEAVSIPVAVAGGIRLDRVKALVASGAKLLVVGSAIVKSRNPAGETASFLQAIEEAWQQL